MAAGDETSDVAKQTAADGASLVSATESVESGVDLGGGSDDEATRDIPQGQMGLAASLFKQERQAHPQPYVLLQAICREARVICLCDSGAASFNLMLEAAYLLAAQSDPTRFDSPTYRLHPLQVGGIEEGRSAVQIVGQVMQTLYDPRTGRPIRFITAIMRNACTGDAEVIFGNRQLASDRWSALIDFGIWLSPSRILKTDAVGHLFYLSSGLCQCLSAARLQFCRCQNPQARRALRGSRRRRPRARVGARSPR